MLKQVVIFGLCVLAACGVKHEIDGTVEIEVSGRAEIVHKLELAFHCTEENGYLTALERKACIQDALECYYAALSQQSEADPQEGGGPCGS